ncbi:hypothetical protein AYO47_05385 [Planctomyces sp. SCGC AG-212-M04]|nr:hypothetical protein AYO47_05385 [Planctomyces sp. SCGC AG-212-M04]
MRFLSLSLLFVLPLSFFGCGGASGPELGTVTGKVMLDGQPVQKATIMFTPEKGPPSYGGTNAQGEYTLMFTADKNGAVLGKHTVTIESGNPETDDRGKPLPDQKVTKVPRKYTSKAGGLTADVKAGSNTFDFNLESK